MQSQRHPWLPIGLAAVVAACVALLFSPSVRYDYIDFDDPGYTYENAAVLSGLSADGVRYAFGGTKSLSIWFPLTVLSYMLDVECGGASAATFHLSSVLWHLLATVSLYFLLAEILRRRAEGGGPSWGVAIWLAAAVGAAFWAVHPQRIESVVWIASRKDLVSGCFAFVSMLCYLKADGWRRPYWLCLFFYLLAIMGKPAVMTLPLAFVCLDLLTGRRTAWRRLVIPCLMAAACAVASVYMQRGNAVEVTALYTWRGRVITSLASLAYYFTAAFWPDRIAILHPWPGAPEYGRAAAGLLAVAAVGALCVVAAARRLKGWPVAAAALGVWFIGSLFPMLNFVVIGNHTRADRFTYYPAIACAVAVAVPLAGLLARRRRAAGWVMGACAAVVSGYACATFAELPHWRDSEKVFARAVRQEPENPMAHHLLAVAYIGRNRVADAVAELRKASETGALSSFETRGLLAHLLSLSGRAEDRREAYALAARVLGESPNEGGALSAMGILSMGAGRWREAEGYFERLVAVSGVAEYKAYEALGIARFNQGKYREAAETFREGMRRYPGDPGFQQYTQRAERKAAEEKLRQAVR